MIALIIGMLVSLIVTLVGTPLLIRLVHKLHYGQYIRQDGPQSHLVKRGTPTLGGVVINFAILLGWASSALYRYLRSGDVPSWSAALVLFAMLSMGLLALSTTSPRCVRSRTKPIGGRQVHRPVHLRHHLRGTCAADSHQIGIPQCAGRHQLHRTAVLQLRLRRPCRSHHPVRHLGELPDDRMDQRSEFDGWT